jgi:cystathionine beta-lyase
MQFDKEIDRRGTWAVKWDDLNRAGGKDEVIPLWVADMDFPSPPEISSALTERAAHPVYGYTNTAPGYRDTLSSWYKERYQADLNREDFLLGPGTVPSLGIVIRSFTAPGDGVLILTPVYHPFFDMIHRNGRETVEAALVLDEQGRYGFDIQALETTLASAAGRGLRVPLALFCSPHNPGGTVWEKAELEGFLDLAEKWDMVVLADEIHGDFVWPPKKFSSLAAFPKYAERVVVVSGANKSFNLGGLHISHFAARDGKLKETLKAGLGAFGYGLPNIFSMAAVDAAYRKGGPWLEEVKLYIRKGMEDAVRYINAGVPGLRAYKPEGTYLIWTDASELITRRGLRNDAELALGLEREGRVKFTPGGAFGRGGRGFIRINAACPRSQLLAGLARLKAWASP